MATLNCPKSSHFLKSSGLLRAMNEMVYLAPDVFRFPCFIVLALQTTCGVEWLIHPEFQNKCYNNDKMKLTTAIMKYSIIKYSHLYCVRTNIYTIRNYYQCNNLFNQIDGNVFLRKNISAHGKVFDVMWQGTRRESVFVRQCLENLVTVLSNT